MEIIRYPSRDSRNALLQRPLADKAREVTDTVTSIMDDVKRNGDEALMRYEMKFTGAQLDRLEVTPEEIDEAESLVSDELRDAIAMARENIAAFHRAQVMSQPVKVTTQPGVTCEQRAVPIDRVGLYIPGGNSPLFSTVLMLAVPARIAGCRDIILCTPAGKDGKVHPAILYAAKAAGVSRIYKTGGAQAIAAMTFGTESIPKVYKIFGPGNRYVMEAKQQATMHGVAIDMPAGPSEVLVIADDEANPEFVAADFLSQAEHGPDSQAIAVCGGEELAARVRCEVERLADLLPRRDSIEGSLSHSRIIVLPDPEEMTGFANLYAPEHLIVATSDPWLTASRITAAGSVFIGHYSPESAGDYASGTNHTLPTSGWAVSMSGVNIDSFMHKITYQELTREGLARLSGVITTMARAEGLAAHAMAVDVRLGKI